MRVLLLAMPDVASSFDRFMRFPNLGLTSLAANVGDAQVRILDLVMHSRAVSQTVRQTLADFSPDLVGLSAMTFQYDTAKQVAAIVRECRPDAHIVLGGYHATLAYESIATDPDAQAFDFMVRGEGEAALNLLVQAIRSGGGYENVPGLSYRRNGAFVHNPRPPLADLAAIRLPARRARISQGFSYFDRRFDVAETSRGCTRACSFCSIRHMYGRGYRAYPIERVIDDIRAAAAAGAQGLFFVDDNINLQPGRLQQLCDAIIDSGLSHLEYISQADVAGFIREPDLPAVMQRAGFTGVFLGIESINRTNWGFLKKSNSLAQTRDVVRSLRAHKIAAVGGLIVGSPDEDAAAVRAAFRDARTLGLDHAIMWCLTPYPGTEIRQQLLEEDLVTNPTDFRWYNGYICNVRTRHLTHRQLVRLIATEGLKLYFHPSAATSGRIWKRRPGAVSAYLKCSLEYLTHAYRNRLYASRHRM